MLEFVSQTRIMIANVCLPQGFKDSSLAPKITSLPCATCLQTCSTKKEENFECMYVRAGESGRVGKEGWRDVSRYHTTPYS